MKIKKHIPKKRETGCSFNRQTWVAVDPLPPELLAIKLALIARSTKEKSK